METGWKPVPHCSRRGILTLVSWRRWGNGSWANVAKAWRKVGSLGRSPGLSQPQRRRRVGGFPSAAMRAAVGGMINGSGDDGGGQPDAGTRRTTLAAPLIIAGEAAQFGEHNDLAALLLQDGAFAPFLGEGGKELAWQALEDRRQVEHAVPTTSRRPTFTRSLNPPSKPSFERASVERIIVVDQHRGKKRPLGAPCLQERRAR